MLTISASNLWKSLNGIICIYKPADVVCTRVQSTIIQKICFDLNQLECRRPSIYAVIEGETNKTVNVATKINLAYDPLVSGPRYQLSDVRCAWSSYLGKHTSGILLFGLQDGTRLANKIRENKLTRAYRIKGILGSATDNFYKDGKVVERSTYKHIKISLLERLLASIQAAHQKQMFEYCGVDVQSKAAYDLAVQGLIRPANSKIPIIYSIKCVEFNLPEFCIEIQCINEYEKYLMTLIHEIGTKLNSTAYCTGIQCIRHSYFTLNNALLGKHWQTQYIIDNIKQCQSILKEHENILLQTSVLLQ